MRHLPTQSRRLHYDKMRGGTLLGLAFGLVVGVLVSFAVVWYLNRTPLPFVEKIIKVEPKDSAVGAPAALPGKPGDKPIEKSGERKFEFYDILEGKKAAAPQAAPEAALASTAPVPPVVVDDGSRLYLQAGAFQKTADAESLKGKLAILGFEASVLDVEVPEKGTLRRVRVGPYANAEAMNRARSQLSQNGIPTTVVRIKE